MHTPENQPFSAASGREREARLCYEAHVEQEKLAYPPYDPKPWAEQDEAVREAWLEHIDRHYAEGGV